MRVNFKFGKQIFDPKIIFGQCTNSTQKVAIPNTALENIRRLDLIGNELWVFYHFGDSLPTGVHHQALYIAD
jgi:hypothetical protein